MAESNYYAIIPADVRYDKRLTANAKLLYGEITALCNSKGFCWAGNTYFADLYDVSTVSISKWISQLVNGGYLIREEIEVTGHKEKFKRALRIVYAPLKEKFNTPLKEKFKHNNTISINNTMNNTMNKDFDLFWGKYPKKEAKQKCLAKYASLYKTNKLPDIDSHVKIIDQWKKTERWHNGYILNPLTWLNGMRWEDDIPPEWDPPVKSKISEELIAEKFAKLRARGEIE